MYMIAAWRNAPLAPVLAVSMFAASAAACQGDALDAPWQAAYFGNRTAVGYPYFTTNHPAIDFDWARGAPLESWVEDDFSIRWEACLRVDRLARITFRLASDDGARLYLNDDRIIDNWRERRFDLAGSRTVVLNPGAYQVRVYYYDAVGVARVQLAMNAEPPGVMEWLPPPASAAPETGLRGCGAGES